MALDLMDMIIPAEYSCVMCNLATPFIAAHCASWMQTKSVSLCSWLMLAVDITSFHDTRCKSALWAKLFFLLFKSMLSI